MHKHKPLCRQHKTIMLIKEKLITIYVLLSAKKSVWSSIIPALPIVPMKFIQSLSLHSHTFIVGGAAADYALVCQIRFWVPKDRNRNRMVNV